MFAVNFYLYELFCQQGKLNWEKTYKTQLGKGHLPATIYAG